MTPNGALLSLIGHSQTELAAGVLRWDRLTRPEWLPADAAAIAEVRATGRCTPYEKEYWRADGSRVPVLIGFTIIGEAQEETIAFILDLTERKQAEAELLQAKRSWSSASPSAPRSYAASTTARRLPSIPATRRAASSRSARNGSPSSAMRGRRFWVAGSRSA